jgi:hypothetical protein
VKVVSAHGDMGIFGVILALSSDPNVKNSSFVFSGSKDIQDIIENAPNKVLLRDWLDKFAALLKWVLDF